MRLEDLEEVISVKECVEIIKEKEGVEYTEQMVRKYIEVGLVVGGATAERQKLPGYFHPSFGWMVLRGDLDWFLGNVWVHRGKRRRVSRRGERWAKERETVIGDE